MSAIGFHMVAGRTLVLCGTRVPHLARNIAQKEHGLSQSLLYWNISADEGEGRRVLIVDSDDSDSSLCGVLRGFHARDLFGPLAGVAELARSVAVEQKHSAWG